MSIFGTVGEFALGQFTFAPTSNSVSETGALADFASNVAVLPSTVSESGSLSDGPSNIAILPSVVGETGSLTDGPSASVVTADSVVEAGALADADSTTGPYSVAVAEAGSLSDAVGFVAGNDGASQGPGSYGLVTVSAPETEDEPSEVRAWDIETSHRQVSLSRAPSMSFAISTSHAQVAAPLEDVASVSTPQASGSFAVETSHSQAL